MKRALAIFAKNPSPGLVKTRLTPPLSPEEAAALYRCMLLDTVNRMGSLGVDIFIFYDGDQSFFETLPGVGILPQEGKELGARLERAFTVLADKGYLSRTVIGSDAPDLPLPFVAEAFQLLETGKEAVFGPAEDGGYYLVALRGGYGTLFREIPWSGAEVLARSLERAQESSLKVSLLSPWYDVDGYDDLYRPGLSDPANEAPLTRAFINDLGITPVSGAGQILSSAC